MKPVTFAHVSDLHLPFEPALSLSQRFSKRQLSAWSWRRRGSMQRPEILAALATELRSPDLDHIVVTGDITNFSLPGEFEQATRWLSALVPAGRISLVPGNHDALVPVDALQAIGLWDAWTHADQGWPYRHRVGGVSLIGLNSALPSAPLLAKGRLGAAQLSRLEPLLHAERGAGQVRVVLLHHPVAAGAVGWRKSLADAAELRAVLKRAGAELVLHGHARDARLDALAGPRDSIPCLCVPSSSALPNPRDEGARWHRLRLSGSADAPQAEVLVRRWSVLDGAFVEAAHYELCLPRTTRGFQDTQSEPKPR